MKIKNETLYDFIIDNILEYNNQYYDPKDENLKLPFFEQKDDVPQEVLRRMDTLKINYNITYQTPEEIEDFNQELKNFLQLLHLKTFSFNVLNSRNKKEPNDYDLSFLDSINQDVEYLSINRVDLSKLRTDYFKRFTNVKTFVSMHSNITPELIEGFSDNSLLDLRGNTILPQDYEKYIAIIQRHNGRVELGDKNLTIYGDLLSKKSISYLDFVRIGDLANIPLDQFTIDMNIGLDGLDDEELSQIASIINGQPAAIINIKAQDLQRLESVQPIRNKVSIRADRIAEFSTDFIKSHPNIERFEVYSKELDNDNGIEYNTYTKDEMLAIRQEVDSILNQIVIPQDGTPNRDKLIFTQIYSILAQRISYDYDAIKKENQRDQKIKKICRDLFGGLIKGLSVCAGYSNILANVLSCVNIIARFIGSKPDIDKGVVFDLNDPHGHAWNEVYLDGQSFLTDLTWDHRNIQAGHFPLKYFLKSKKDFGHDKFAFTVGEGECLKSVSNKEQVDLFRQIGYDIPDPEVKDEQTQNSISTLSSLVVASSKEIPSSAIRIAAKQIEQGLTREESVIDEKTNECDRYQ